MKKFIIDTVIPSLTLYEDVLVTREESKIYKQIDKVLGQAVIETLEPFEEIEGYEIVETKKVVSRPSKKLQLYLRRIICLINRLKRSIRI
jgi:hypothetical protein